MPAYPSILKIDAAEEVGRIVGDLKKKTGEQFRKRGAVVGVSGGVDSAVVLSLCVQTFGAGKVLAVLLPEKDSNPDSLVLAQKVARSCSVDYIVEDISPVLEGFGCYQRRDKAIRNVFPEFDQTCKAKITLPAGDFEQDKLNFYQLTIITGDGKQITKRVPLAEYLQIVAASNFKQRSRMSMLYYHAESRNYAVAGTTNKNEHDLGFFVKYGDGGADIQPIIHLYKTQVYQLAEFLQIPPEIISRVPTTDTYSAAQSQQEFFYRLPFNVLDTIWAGWEQGLPEQEIAGLVNFTVDQVRNVIKDLQRKIAATNYLRSFPF